jgi:hypothetical protein
MAPQNDFKKEWPEIRKQLTNMSREALKLAKKGEDHLLALSKKGKLHLDTAAMEWKRDHIYERIGREYIKANCPGPHTPRLKQYIDELNRMEKNILLLKKRLQAPEEKIARKKGAVKKKNALSDQQESVNNPTVF